MRCVEERREVNVHVLLTPIEREIIQRYCQEHGYRSVSAFMRQKALEAIYRETALERQQQGEKS